MNQDLFCAILAMDSYSRGYSSGISGITVTVHYQRAAVSVRVCPVSGSVQS